jgi:dTDP-4-dehydrorhamnose 3,5-epimerase
MLPGLLMIEDVLITKLDVVGTPGGNVMHGMKETSVGYMGFGEAYFSQVDKGAIKAWKRHKEMTLNLIVPVGEIRFVLFDDRRGSITQFQEVKLSNDNYCRLTVPPMIWVGFQGLSDGGSMLLNIANIEHDPYEVVRKNLEKIEFNWSN